MSKNPILQKKYKEGYEKGFKKGFEYGRNRSLRFLEKNILGGLNNGLTKVIRNAKSIRY
ncbi:hypothetical protein [Virgibacillus alimentarius]|uniref:hypothetical protein n=1 Tax=Virgibacillus alimentarius TaxID=698769 RepID=UPI0018DD3B22|nr:hypothetical protein [Virgibacillus alimentarius]